MTDFERKYKALYRRTYEFHERYYNMPADSGKWNAMAEEGAKISNSFERALAVEVYKEIGRKDVSK